MNIEGLLTYNITQTKKELDERATDVYNYLVNLHNIINKHLFNFKNVEGYKLAKQEIIYLNYNRQQVGIIKNLLDDPNFNITANQSTLNDIKQRISFINSEWGEVIELQNQK